MKRRHLLKGCAVAASVVVVAGACGSSSKSSTSTANEPTFTVGVITDVTGPGSVTGGTTEDGIKAGVALAAAEGYHINYVLEDTQTSLSEGEVAAKTLVEQDHAFAVVQISVIGFSAAPYLKSVNEPEVGADVDGDEWLTSPNMFSVNGYEDYTKVQTTIGQIFKRLGATTYGGIGYGIEPSSAQVVQSGAVSAKLAGLKVGYVNANVPLGSTNMAPIALAMKDSGVDGFYPAVTTQSSFALAAALREAGDNFKVGLMPTGYGGDLKGGGAAASQEAQGLYFTSGAEPAEIGDSATKQFMHYLQTAAGVSGDPTLSEYYGYMSIAALVQGLKAAGPKPTQASFEAAMLKITSFNGAGLYGNHPVSFSMQGRGTIAGADNCEWLTRYEGTTFHLVPGMDPICGQTVPGAHI